MVQERQQIGTASVGYARALMAYLGDRQIDPGVVFGEQWASDSAPAWDNARHRLPGGQWQWMLERCIQHLGDPALPLRLAAFMTPSHFGVVGYLVMSCETLGVAAASVARFEALLNGVNEVVFQMHPQHWELQWHPLSPSDSGNHSIAQMAMALWIQQGRLIAARPDLCCEAHFTFEQPDDPDVVACYRSTFGTEPRFGQAVNKLLVPLDYLSVKVVQHDASVHEVLRARAEADLLELAEQGGAFLRAIESLLADRLDSGGITLTEVAQAMALSPRKLQRQLDEHGVTYRTLLDRVRCKLADRYLSDPSMPLADIAILLGFSDQSSFQHAYKRWTGSSPGEFRRGRTKTPSA